MGVAVTWARWSPTWATAELTPVEQERVACAVTPAARRRSVLRALVVRHAAARALGVAAGSVDVDRTCADCGKQHGRPRVIGSGIDISDSHAPGTILVAIGMGGLVGVDVQPTAEGAEIWVRKEAVLKCDGVGLRVHPSAVSVSTALEPPVLQSYPARPAFPDRLWLADLVTPFRGLTAALAVDPGPKGDAPVVGGAHVLRPDLSISGPIPQGPWSAAATRARRVRQDITERETACTWSG